MAENRTRTLRRKKADTVQLNVMVDAGVAKAIALHCIQNGYVKSVWIERALQHRLDAELAKEKQASAPMVGNMPADVAAAREADRQRFLRSQGQAAPERQAPERPVKSIMWQAPENDVEIPFTGWGATEDSSGS